MFTKNFVKVLLLFIAVNIAGMFLWPYFSYLTGYDIGILCYGCSAVVALFGMILFIDACIRKRSKRISLWTIALACALFSTTGRICDRYGDKGDFVGEYIRIYNTDKDREYPNVTGLADKFGCEFIEPQYDCVMKVFSNDKASYIYVGGKSHLAKRDSMVDGDNVNFYSFVLYLHDEHGKLKSIKNITESDCDDIDDYIEKHIGKITDRYGSFVDERMIKTIVQVDTTLEAMDDDCQEVVAEENDVELATSEADNENDEEVKEVVVRHVHERQQVWKQRWRPCISCDRGKCKLCHGQGGYYIGDMYNFCMSCSGTGACALCDGRGEIMETYSTWE